MVVRLESLANVAVIVMCCAVAATALSSWWPGDSVSISNPPHSQPYAAGETLEVLPPDATRSAHRSVVLVLRSGCRFCTESMPFYKRLSQRRTSEDDGFKLVALVVEPTAVGQAYLAEHGLTADMLMRLPIAQARRITGTPTLLVIDRTRKILGVWIGRLDPAAEREVEEMLRTATAP